MQESDAGLSTPTGRANEVLPQYTVRRSSRAQRIRISVTPHDGVVLIVPVGVVVDADQIVRERIEWIEEAKAEFADRRAALLGDLAELLPHIIDFWLTGEAWDVRYRETPSATVRVMQRGGELVVSGDTRDAGKCIAALQRWLHRTAAPRLTALLHTEATLTGLRYARCSVRGQRHRWGGCTHDGHITLNRGLVFLDPETVRAIMRHELAHLVHPDHSKSFWAQLAAIDADVDSHRVLIARSRDAIPLWAEWRSPDPETRPAGH